MPQETAEAATPHPKAPSSPPQLMTPTGRIAVGAVFALGLYLGLRKLATGVVLASHPNPDAWWASFDGLLAVCGGQIVAVIFGAVLAAASRVGGLGFGAAVGGLCGSAFLAAELVAGAPPQDLVLYIQPLVLIVVGGIAGVFAARVWGAVPAIDMPVPDRNRLSSSRFTLGMEPEMGRPTAWLQVLVGAMMMVVAVTAVEQVRSKMQKNSGGLLHVNSVGEGQFLTWQFAVFGVLAGGVLAGAATGAGIRHGVLAGGLGGVGVLGVTAIRGELLTPVRYWLNGLSLRELTPNEPAVILATLSGMLLLGLLGGWLGGTLFLPLAPEHMRNRLQTGLD